MPFILTCRCVHSGTKYGHSKLKLTHRLRSHILYATTHTHTHTRKSTYSSAAHNPCSSKRVSQQDSERREMRRGGQKERERLK